MQGGLAISMKGPSVCGELAPQTPSVLVSQRLTHQVSRQKSLTPRLLDDTQLMPACFFFFFAFEVFEDRGTRIEGLGG